MMWLRGLLIVAVIVAAGAAAALWEVDRRVSAPFRSFAGEEVFVDVPPGTGE